MREATLPRRQIAVPREAALREAPWSFDWFGVMRWMEARNPDWPRFGEALRPSDEPVRVSQDPSLAFAPATLSRIGSGANGRLTLEQTAFGLFGPNGPMPLHLTEHVRARSEYDRDRSQRAFSDIFHHRFALLFYRAWASAQSTVSLDRPGEDRFSHYVDSLSGYGQGSLNRRDTVPDHARRHMAGHLVRSTRCPSGLQAILEDFFDCRFRVQEWMPSWLRLEPDERTALGREADSARLGQGAICGVAVPDRQHRFRLHAGPLGLSAYEAFLPGHKREVQVRDWVRNYIGFELEWDLRLILRKEEVPKARLGETARLGWTSWLGGATDGKDRGDLVIEGERGKRDAGESNLPHQRMKH